MDGKAMLVCMSRRIRVDYKALTALRAPTGTTRATTAADRRDDRVMSDPSDWQQHICSKQRREALAKRFKNPERPLQARHRPRHVAHGLRRPVHAHDVHRQADVGMV
ncbi:MAG: hypothetical protein U0168_21160 [Nannocystaceae bacterium]